jgi:hypothetical protein
MDIGLIETRTDAQLRLGRQDADLYIVAIMLVEQACRAECAPYTAKTGADDQDVLFHDVLPKTKSIR